MAAHYLAADTALVTPLADGMNLVAKEFVVAQMAAGRSGALVLSERAGAAAELVGATMCDPRNIEGMSAAIEQAVDMAEVERWIRMAWMSQAMATKDITSWARQQFQALDCHESATETSPNLRSGRAR